MARTVLPLPPLLEPLPLAAAEERLLLPPPLLELHCRAAPTEPTPEQDDTRATRPALLPLGARPAAGAAGAEGILEAGAAAEEEALPGLVGVELPGGVADGADGMLDAARLVALP